MWRRTIQLLHLTVVVACSARANAQDGELQSDVRAWFTREWEAAKTPPSLSTGLRWRMANLSHPGAEALAQLREAVKDRPEHPQRQMIEAYERHMRGIPTEVEFTAFLHGDSSWRINTDALTSRYMNDVCVHEGVSWRMGGVNGFVPMQITRRAMERGGPMHSDESGFRMDPAHLLQGGLGIRFFHQELVTPTLTIDQAGNWKATTEDPPTGPQGSAFTAVFQGRWDATAGRGFVDTMILTKAGVAHVHRYSNWKYHNPPGVWAADSMEYATGDQTKHFVRLVGFPELPKGGFEEVFRMPEPGKPDALRGMIPETVRMFDETSGTLTEVDLMSGKRTPIGPTDVRMVQRGFWFSGWHWGIAGAVMLVIGFVLVRRMRGSA